MYDRPFRWWVQSVMPLVFDDSLSYYEVLAKLTKYIEGLTGDVDQIEKILETIEGIEDVAQFTEMLENIKSEIGDLANLSTQTKSNLVSAINEVALKADIAYWKPPTGIPESDLSEGVRDKLNKTGSATEYIINNVKLKASPSNNSPSDLGLGTYTVPSGGIPWDTLSQDVRDRIESDSGEGGTKDYTDLSNKPQINGHTLNAGNNTAESLGLGTYSKPSTGIPESDLSAEVQEKLNTSGGIADDETSFVATREYNPGELVYINGTLYKVVNKILPGSNMVPGNNIVVTDISSEIERIDGEIDSLQSGAGPDSWSLVANVTAQSVSIPTRFFEYFNAISGEDYLVIVTPDSTATSSNRYQINIAKRDGTVVYTETVDVNPQNQQRFTFSPVDTGEYYCEIKKIFDSDPSVSVRVELQYTASQGISELWSKVNQAISVSGDISALNEITAQHTQQIGALEVDVEALNDLPARVNNIENILDELTEPTKNKWPGDQIVNLVRGTANNYYISFIPVSLPVTLSFVSFNLSGITQIGVQTRLNGTAVENVSVDVSEDSRTSLTFNSTFDQIGIYTKSGTENGSTFSAKEIQLEYGSSATEYTPILEVKDSVARDIIDKISNDSYNVWDGVNEFTLVRGTNNYYNASIEVESAPFAFSFKCKNLNNITTIGIMTRKNNQLVFSNTYSISEGERVGVVLDNNDIDTIRVYTTSATASGASVTCSDIQLTYGDELLPYSPKLTAIDYVARGYIGLIPGINDMVKNINLPVNELSKYNAFTCVNKHEINLDENTKILAFGDSITHGGDWGVSWVTQLSDILGCENTNKAVTGAVFGEEVRTSGYWLSTQLNGVTAEEWSAATLIFIACGTNDAGYNTSDTELYSKVQSAITTIRTHTNVPIVFITPIKRGATDADANYFKLPKISGIIEHVALLNKCSVICGLNFPIPSHDEGVISNLMSGYIHPNSDGGYIYALSVLTALT